MNKSIPSNPRSLHPAAEFQPPNATLNDAAVEFVSPTPDMRPRQVEADSEEDCYDPARDKPYFSKRLAHMRESVLETMACKKAEIDRLPSESDFDRAAAASLSEHAAVLIKKEIANLARIDAALKKLNDGTFGVSIHGEDIPYRRLVANPTAVTTIEEENERFNAIRRGSTRQQAKPPEFGL